MKFNKTISIVTISVAIFGAVATLYEYNKYNNGYINFTVNNQKIKCQSIKEIKEYIENDSKVYLDSIDVTDCVEIEADTSALDNLSFIDYIKLENSNINVDTNIVDLNNQSLSQKLKGFNNEQSKSIDAKIVNNGSTYEIESEVVGTQVDIQKILEDIQKDYSNIQYIKFDDYKIQPDITSEDLKDLVDRANKYLLWEVEYSNGTKFKSNIQSVIIEDTDVKLDFTFIGDIVKELEKTYDTVGKGFEFTDKDGNTSTVLNGTYGNIMNSAEEKAYLTSLFENTQSEYNRTPVMKQELPEKIGNTYLEISIQEQHMWHFVENELCCETDIVTGDANKKRDTPLGVYFISERISGKYLTGADYRTWVNKWMRLTNTGVGLHDAGWRGSFGGRIYKGNGSHGCINLPKKYAYNLFDEVYRKIPVVIY